MSQPKPICQELRRWLKANLGKGCLAPLTGTDARVLDAAVHIAELWCHAECAELSDAFGLVVALMQPSTQELAYHAVAMVGEWHYREKLWTAAALPPLAQVRVCAFEPGGSER